MKTVLAVFAKTPRPGRVKTRLTPQLSLAEGAELYRCMLLDTIARVRALPCDTVIFYEGDAEFFQGIASDLLLIPQHHAGLGERLEDAFATLSTFGYRERVIIGSDAPDLPLDFVEEAFRLLADGKEAVFGPAEDGGYYLVGLSGGSCGLFREIPWSGPEVLAVSLQRGREAGITPALLPPWCDVDGFEDLQRPGLSDPSNGASLTRKFLQDRGIGVTSVAEPSSFPAS